MSAPKDIAGSTEIDSSAREAKVNLAKVVGTPTKTLWAQVHKFDAEVEKLQTRGQLFAAVALDLDFAGINQATAFSVTVGHEVITRLNEEYYGGLVSEDNFARRSPFEYLKKAVETVTAEFSQGIKLEVCAGVLWQGYVYFCVWGRGKIFLARNTRLASLLRGEENKLSLVSGRFTEGDVYCLATSALSNLIDQESFSRLFARYQNISDLADNLAPLAHRSSLPGLAAAFVRPEAGVGQAETVGEEISREEKIVAQKTGGSGIFRFPKQSVLKGLLIKVALKLPEEAAANYRLASGKKTAVSVGILLLVLFSLSIGFGLKQKKEQEYRLSYETQFLQARSAYEDALLYKETDPAKAKQSFVLAKQAVDGLVARGIKDPQLAELAAKIQQDLPDLLGEVRTDAVTFLDLSIVRTGITSSEIALHGQTIAVLDKEGKRIVSASVDKETVVLGGAQKLSGPKAVAVYANRYFALDDQKVVELDKKGNIVNEIKAGEGWQNPAKIGVFGGNLYLLDRGDPSPDSSGQIWRYSSSSDGKGFGEKQAWLGSGVKPDFSKVADMAIDGSIWVANQDGSVVKLTRGAPTFVKLTGLDQHISAIEAIYTDENLENFYVLEKQEGRLVEFAKNGEYRKQYLVPQISETIDFVVSGQDGKIFLLTPSKVLELPLK